MAKNSKPQPQTSEYDSVYFLKILIYLIVGSLWVTRGSQATVPIGLIAGLILVQHEKLQLDRKIEYAMLIVGCVLGLIGVGVRIAI
jgi:hypothetical protein